MASGASASAQPSEPLSAEPDVIINTKSLFDLPKDVISIPPLRDLLTEDFVFYYRDGGEDWLSFRGALARIAFEKKTDWPLRLMSWLMNGPAELALWKGSDGKLTRYALVIDQTGVKELAKSMAEAALSDSQLRSETVNGHALQVLKLANEKEVYIGSEGGRLYMFSDPNIPLPWPAQERSFIERAKSFFGANEEVALFGPKPGASRHVLTVAAKYFAFGYQEFFAGISALRFDFDGKMWGTRVRATNALKAVDPKDWTQMPRGAAFCIAVPIDPKKVGAVAQAKAWLDKAFGNAVACWYPESKLYTPLLALRGDFAANLNSTDDLKKVFSNMIGSREAIWVKGPGEDEPPTLKWLPKLVVAEVKGQSGKVAFTREVGGRYGLYPGKQSKNEKKLGSKRFFRVKLVATPESILFSPDDRLVDRALSTLSGKFPSVAASLPPQGKSSSVILAPEPFSQLAKASILESLPASQESLFRTAVSRHLFPNLDSFAKRPLVTATLGSELQSGGGQGRWNQVEWLTHAAK